MSFDENEVLIKRRWYLGGGAGALASGLVSAFDSSSSVPIVGIIFGSTVIAIFVLFLGKFLTSCAVDQSDL